MNRFASLNGVDLEERLIAFELAWKSGMPPDIDGFVSPSSITNDSNTLDTRFQELLELIPLDLEYRWRAPSSRLRGAFPPRPRLEDYLSRYPELIAAAGIPTELVGAEYRTRWIWGDRPKPVEYLARFPCQAERLTDEFSKIDDEITREYSCDEPDSNTQSQAAHRFSKEEDLSRVPEIDGLEILGELGRGAMGIVYKAYDPKLGRIVALKTMAEGQFASEDQIERFRAEAQAIARLRHPNIIAINTIGEHENCPYLSLEFADGGSLAQRLAEKPMTSRDAAEIAETLALAVHFAHEAGIIHRDLKPSNVLLSASSIPKVSDFGLAKLLDGDAGRTLSGQVMGSPSYMAPEQADGHSKQVGPTADTYALGAILYHALTGRPPFLGESVMETLKLVTSTEVVALHLLRPDVPRDLETICLKCLEKEPQRRYASSKSLAADLRRFLDHRPIAARPVGPLGRFGRWSRRNPWIAGLSAAVFLSLSIGIGLSTALALRARRAEIAVGRQRDLALIEAEITKAVNGFLTSDLLAQASAHNQAGPGSRPDRDLKVRDLLDRAATKIGDRFANQPLVEATIRQTIGETYHQLGLLPQAREQLQLAYRLRRQILGENHPETLVLLVHLGNVELTDYNVDKAEPLLIDAMNGLRSTRGPEHSDTLAAIHAVGRLRIEQGQFSEAENLLKSLQETYLRTRGTINPEILEVTYSLAFLYMRQTKLDLAEKLLLRFLDDAPTVLGKDHPSTLAARSALASIYRDQKDNARATKLHEEVLKDQGRVLGRRHPDTLITMSSLGCLYAAQGLGDQAEPLLIETLEACRTTLDRNHISALAALAGLSDIYTQKVVRAGSSTSLTKNNDMKTLGKYLLEGAQICAKTLGPNDPSTISAKLSLAQYHVALDEYGTGESYFRDCSQFWLQNAPQDRLRFINEVNLAVCLLAQKKFSEAKAHFLIGYNGIRKIGEQAPLPEEVDLDWLIQQILQLRETSGQSMTETTIIGKIHKNPALKAILSDLQFPENPFAQ